MNRHRHGYIHLLEAYSKRINSPRIYIYTSGCKEKNNIHCSRTEGVDAESSNGYIQMGLPKSQVPPG